MCCYYSVYSRVGKLSFRAQFDKPKQASVYIDGMKKEFGSRFKYRVFQDYRDDNGELHNTPLHYYPSRCYFVDYLFKLKIYY